MKGGGASASCGSPWSPDHSSPRAGESSCSNHTNLYKCTCWWQHRYTLFLVSVKCKTRTRGNSSELYSCAAWFRKATIYWRYFTTLLRFCSVSYEQLCKKLGQCEFDSMKPKYSEKKPPPVPIFPSKFPHGLAWDSTSTYVVQVQRLTVWAMAKTVFLLRLTWPRVTVNNDLQKCAPEKGVTELAKKKYTIKKLVNW